MRIRRKTASDSISTGLRICKVYVNIKVGVKRLRYEPNEGLPVFAAAAAARRLFLARVDHAATGETLRKKLLEVGCALNSECQEFIVDF